MLVAALASNFSPLCAIVGGVRHSVSGAEMLVTQNIDISKDIHVVNMVIIPTIVQKHGNYILLLLNRVCYYLQIVSCMKSQLQIRGRAGGGGANNQIQGDLLTNFKSCDTM